MANWKSHGLIKAPTDEVWDLVGDPNRHAEWFPLVMEVSGLPIVRIDATYRQVSRTPGKARETTFLIEDLDDMHEIGLRCTDTGTYVRFLLTPAQGETFVEIDIGLEPTSTVAKAVGITIGKRYVKRWAEDALEGLRSALNEKTATPST